MLPTTLPPSNLSPLLPSPETPWLISQPLFQRLQGGSHLSSSYHKTEITSQDPEWNFLLRYFEWQKPTNRSIAKAYCIHNPSHTLQFEAGISNSEQQSKNPAFTPKWSQEDHPTLRKTVVQRWKDLTAPYTPFTLPNKRKDECHHTKIAPLWHGTKEAICDSICSTGFTTFGKHDLIKGTGAKTQNTDIGFFGSGIYFTTSARYAAAVYSDGNLLLAWVSMREPYPVVADGEYAYPQKPQDMRKLEGLGAYQNYNAHYIPVIPINPSDPQCSIYYPCADTQDPALDELVVFSSSQTLARFWVQLQADLIQAPTVTTIDDLLQHVLDLLEKEEIQKDPNLSHLLEEKSNFLIALSPQSPLSSSDQKFYNWAKQLFDTTGKVRTFAQKKLQQIHSGKETVAPQHPPVSIPVQIPQNVLPTTQSLKQSQSSPQSTTPSTQTPQTPTIASTAAKWHQFVAF